MFLFEIAKGGSTVVQQHLFEKVIYVLEGHGSTQVELANGSKHLIRVGPSQSIRDSSEREI
jgi:quercetin dioxygenase-like cupin family protein